MKNRLMILPLLVALLSCGCYAPQGRTMADEAYAQNYSTGQRSSARNFTGSEGVLGIPAAICYSIDRAKTARERSRHCQQLWRVLSDGNAPAYEWQSYYSRCNQ
ncbi:MAG: hypothetical protein JNJ69_05095 [Leptospiraceae bacterium]|nr:hypothetical protein [Leptospiraceae bacterium]